MNKEIIENEEEFEEDPHANEFSAEENDSLGEGKKPSPANKVIIALILAGILYMGYNLYMERTSPVDLGGTDCCSPAIVMEPA